jgi:hypothetical protein
MFSGEGVSPFAGMVLVIVLVTVFVTSTYLPQAERNKAEDTAVPPTTNTAS